jgi:hypothetical protein
MRGLSAFLALGGSALLLFTLGQTVGPHELNYLAFVVLIAVCAGLALKMTSGAIDWGTVFMTGRPPKDD